MGKPKVTRTDPQAERLAADAEAAAANNARLVADRQRRRGAQNLLATAGPRQQLGSDSATQGGGNPFGTLLGGVSGAGRPRQGIVIGGTPYSAPGGTGSTGGGGGGGGNRNRNTGRLVSN